MAAPALPDAPEPTTTSAGAQLTGRIALITGASRGLGAAVARRFAAEGAKVILAARTVGALEEVDDAVRAAGAEATLVPIDLTEPDTIDALGGSIYQRFGRLDIVVGNAATLGSLGPVAQSDADAWRRVVDLNLMANYRLIRSVDLLLRASDAGRAIFVTADVAREARAYWSAYAVSKAALEMLVRLYAAETERTKIRVNLIDPGPLRTRLRAAAFPGEDARTVPLPETATDPFVRLARPDWTETGQRVGPERGAIS